MTRTPLPRNSAPQAPVARKVPAASTAMITETAVQRVKLRRASKWAASCGVRRSATLSTAMARTNAGIGTQAQEVSVRKALAPREVRPLRACRTIAAGSIGSEVGGTRMHAKVALS